MEHVAPCWRFPGRALHSRARRTGNSGVHCGSHKSENGFVLPGLHSTIHRCGSRPCRDAVHRFGRCIRRAEHRCGTPCNFHRGEYAPPHRSSSWHGGVHAKGLSPITCSAWICHFTRSQAANVKVYIPFYVIAAPFGEAANPLIDCHRPIPKQDPDSCSLSFSVRCNWRMHPGPWPDETPIGPRPPRENKCASTITRFPPTRAAFF